MDPLKLENQLCFPLYAASRAVVKLYTPLLEPLGLTYTQYITLMVLWEHKCMSVKQLGQLLHLDSGTLTPVLKKLESSGYVSRQRSSEDERVLIASITESGEALRARAMDIPQAMGRCIDLEPEQAKALYALLYRILEVEA